MAEAVDCSECGATYDSEQHPFCPRCGSTSRGAPMPGAVASAARHAPGRRRVQAAGVVLLAIGLLFLAGAAFSLFVPVEEAAASMDADDLARFPGGEVRVRFPSDGNATVVLSDLDGNPLANVTGAGPELALQAPEPRVVLNATQGNASWGRELLVLSNDAMVVKLDEPGAEGKVLVSPLMRSALRTGGYLALAFSVLLIVGGSSALALRFFAVAATGAGVSAFMALFAVLVLLAAGLLFALPLGMAAYFILRGRRHFKRRAPRTPPGA